MRINTKSPVETFLSIWRSTDLVGAFLSDLPKLGEIAPYKLCSLVVFSSGNSDTAFNNVAPLSYESKLEEQRKNSSLYYLNTYVGKEKKEKVEGRVIIFQESPGVFVLFTLCTRDFLHKCLLRFLGHSYPKIVQPVLKQNELREILFKTEERFSPQTIRIVKTSAKRWIVAREPSGRKKQLGSRVDWEKMSIPIRDAFKEASEEGKWFTTLTFRVYIQRGDALYGTSWTSTISKKGMFLTNKWLPQYSEVIVPSLLSLAEGKMNLYRNRSRANTMSHEVRPLVIKFGETVFEDTKTNEEFIDALKKIPHFGYSVMHSNPYIHMSLLDYKDGSSFEILVHEPNKIVILPQIRATSVSLERVIGHIAEEFSEGEVVDLQTSQ